MEQMNNSDEIFSSLGLYAKEPNTADTDFTFEVIAASLIEQGVHPDQIEIVRDGIARRGISKDIASVAPRYSVEEPMNYIQINVNREGL